MQRGEESQQFSYYVRIGHACQVDSPLGLLVTCAAAKHKPHQSRTAREIHLHVMHVRNGRHARHTGSMFRRNVDIHIQQK